MTRDEFKKKYGWRPSGERILMRDRQECRNPNCECANGFCSEGKLYMRGPAPRQLTRAESIDIDKAAGVHPNLRFCRDESCKIPHEHEAHDKVYDVTAHLDAVAAVIGERGKTRDLSKGERSMARCVRAYNAITGEAMSCRNGWLFMACLKLARMQTGRYKQDDYLDHTGYSALMAEEARREHEKQSNQ